MVRTYRTGWLALYLPVGIVFCGWFALLELALFIRSIYLLVADGRAISLAGGLGSLVAGLALGVGFGWLLKEMLGRAHTVRLGDDGACELRSLVRRRRLHASSIAWVRAERDDEHDIVDASVGYCRG
jgi:hypothetical protein